MSASMGVIKLGSISNEHPRARFCIYLFVCIKKMSSQLLHMTRHKEIYMWNSAIILVQSPRRLSPHAFFFFCKLSWGLSALSSSGGSQHNAFSKWGKDTYEQDNKKTPAIHFENGLS